MEQALLDRTPNRPPIGDQSVLTRFARRRQNIRFILYALLLLCDVVAIRMAFTTGVSMAGYPWMAPHGIELGWIILPIHLLVGLSDGAYSYQSVHSRLHSVARAVRAFVFATALTSMLIFFQHSGNLVSRLGFGVSILLSVLFIIVIRAAVGTLFVVRGDSWMFGELLIVDEADVPAGYRGDVLDASEQGFVPNMNDPLQLSRIAEEIAPYDRVIVMCGSQERRAEWAKVLKCYQVSGEIVLSGGSPLGAIGVDRFHGEDTVVVARRSLSLGNRIKKRLMDIFVSSLALIFIAPLLLVVAVLIKLDSRGPVFFAQPRVGRDNRMFRILKFRSMRVESSDIAGSRSTSRDDDRITRVGRVIRMTSIDELPQLINVLKGDMSVVGPRPHALGSLAGNKLFWEVDTAYWRRHTLRPGITGLAQIRGFRGATHEQSDLENRLQSDLEYISGWSLWRDVKILLSTIRVVVHSRAY